MREALEGGGHTNAKRDAIVLNAGVGIYVSASPTPSTPASPSLARPSRAARASRSSMSGSTSQKLAAA